MRRHSAGHVRLTDDRHPVLDHRFAGPRELAVSVLLGGPGGTFSTPTRLGVGTAPFALVSTDLNGDGTPDLATADFLTRTVS